MSFIRLSKSSLLLALVLLAASGCASDEKSNSTYAGSSIPWNKPEKWEGPGVLGSAIQGTQ